jgi:hypothetical protein
MPETFDTVEEVREHAESLYSTLPPIIVGLPRLYCRHNCLGYYNPATGLYEWYRWRGRYEYAGATAEGGTCVG